MDARGTADGQQSEKESDVMGTEREGACGLGGQNSNVAGDGSF